MSVYVYSKEASFKMIVAEFEFIKKAVPCDKIMNQYLPFGLKTILLVAIR